MVCVILNDHLYHLMKHFFPDGSGLFQDGNAPIHRALHVTQIMIQMDPDHVSKTPVTAVQSHLIALSLSTVYFLSSYQLLTTFKAFSADCCTHCILNRGYNHCYCTMFNSYEKEDICILYHQSKYKQILPAQ